MCYMLLCWNSVRFVQQYTCEACSWHLCGGIARGQGHAQHAHVKFRRIATLLPRRANPRNPGMAAVGILRWQLRQLQPRGWQALWPLRRPGCRTREPKALRNA